MIDRLHKFLEFNKNRPQDIQYTIAVLEENPKNRLEVTDSGTSRLVNITYGFYTDEGTPYSYYTAEDIKKKVETNHENSRHISNPGSLNSLVHLTAFNTINTR